jgi:hypothetical protein
MEELCSLARAVTLHEYHSGEVVFQQDAAGKQMKLSCLTTQYCPCRCRRPKREEASIVLLHKAKLRAFADCPYAAGSFFIVLCGTASSFAAHQLQCLGKKPPRLPQTTQSMTKTGKLEVVA